MPRFFRAFSWCVVLSIAGYTHTEVARADDARVTIVDISPRAAELDPARLRDLLTTELHMPAVAPSDPRASAAVGTLTIDVDRATGDLAVTYLARDLPTTRHIPLPKDDASARSAAVALSGNLARNEAQEIEATLRPPRAAVPSHAPLSDEPDASHLRATIDGLATNDQHHRQALAWTFIGTGALGVGTAVYMGTQSQSKEGLGTAVGTFGAGLLIGGAIGLFLDGPFDDLSSYAREDGVTGSALEGAWAAAARREHSHMRTAGILGLVAGGLTLGFGAVALTDSKLFPDPTERNAFGASFLILGVVDTVIAIDQLATEGPVESAFHAYQDASGRRPPVTALLGHINVTPTAGGAMGVFATTF